MRFHKYVADPPKWRIKRPRGVSVEPPSDGPTKADYQAALAAGAASTPAEA